jgi:hypothetical protein
MPRKDFAPSSKVRCPRCGQNVPPADGEYARHYLKGGELCVGSKREISARKGEAP